MRLRLIVALGALFMLTGCPMTGTTTNVRDSGSAPGMTDAQLAAYDGPQARIAVARFEDKTGASSRWWNRSIGDGMADMLTTALFNSGRFIVLERQAVDDVIFEQDLGASGRVREETAAAIGQIEGAELLVVAAVTEFDGNAGGTTAALGAIGAASGSRAGRILGGLTGGTKSAHMAIDLRIIDTETSRILAATSVEGTARDFDISGAVMGYTGRGALGGALSSWENTPREKALREVIVTAVDEIVRRTPQQYYRHGGNQSHQEFADSAREAVDNDRVVVTASSLNVRSAPGTDSAVVARLNAGNIVNVLARDGSWIQVDNDKGTSGWISADHVVEVN
ncbi:MAG TPA: CsgG/HfaB family protein [Wenzhouxiangella sp.]|nr:CsgG/HfaB family protein [Wenzhouxiangella sp.]